jgi:hypothetical protein
MFYIQNQFPYQMFVLDQQTDHQTGKASKIGIISIKATIASACGHWSETQWETLAYAS